MKVWIAVDRDHQALAVFARKADAERAGIALEMEVYQKLPTPAKVWMRRGVFSKPSHPTDWSKNLTKPHIHTETNMDCWVHNKGHTQYGPCKQCRIPIVSGDITNSLDYYPWTQALYPLPQGPKPSVKRSKAGGPRVVSIVGRDKNAIDQTFAKELEAYRKELASAT